MDEDSITPISLGKNPESPESGISLAISYSDVNGLEGCTNALGSPFADNTVIINSASASFSSNDSLNSLSPTVSNSIAGSLANAGMIPFTEMGILGPSIPPLQASRMIETLQSKLRNDGYSESALSEITAALNTLAYYGMLGPGLSMLNSSASMGFGMGMSNFSFNNSPLFPTGIANPTVYTHSPAMTDACTSVAATNPMTRIFNPMDNLTSNMPGVGLYPGFTSNCADDHFLMSIDAAGFDPSFCQNSPAVASPSAAALPTNNNSFGLGTSSSPEIRKLNGSQHVPNLGATKIELEVRENIVGAILGPGGKSLVEIQRHSGANIQISKKGVFVPGTRNRIVAITGMPNAVYMAQCLIENQIVEEETKRAQRNAHQQSNM